MATNPQVAALTQAQQQAQYANSALVSAIVTQFFLSIAEEDYDTQIAELMKAVLPLLEARRVDSASLAARFYADVRELVVPSVAEAFEVINRGELNLDQARSSLIFTGPSKLKQLIEKGEISPEEAKTVAAEAVGGSAQRLVADGGRYTIIDTANADPVALGHVRITQSAKPCFYCAMLASRGPVYTDESFDESDARFTGPGDAKVHDNCHCTMRAVFSRRDDIPANVARYSKLWGDSTKGFSGKAAVNAFRRAYDALDDNAA